jgi:hypothetical protein
MLEGLETGQKKISVLDHRGPDDHRSVSGAVPNHGPNPRRRHSAAGGKREDDVAMGSVKGCFQCALVQISRLHRYTTDAQVAMLISEGGLDGTRVQEQNVEPV